MSYWRLFYHCVWATKNREPLISAEYDEIVKRSINASCHEQSVLVHALETMPDHVHLVVSIPPALAIASFMNIIKGSTSHLINSLEPVRQFYWQPEYGVHSFSEDVLPKIVDYVQNQRSQHASRRLWPSLEINETPRLTPNLRVPRAGGPS